MTEFDDVDAIVAGLVAWLVSGSAPPAQTSMFVNGKLIDLVAVRHALEGVDADQLSTHERRVAAAVGTLAGLSAEDIGRRLQIAKRSVVRYRKMQRAGAAA
jgi:membrane protein implicated in regulation of membrane protease activity